VSGCGQEGLDFERRPAKGRSTETMVSLQVGEGGLGADAAPDERLASPSGRQMGIDPLPDIRVGRSVDRAAICSGASGLEDTAAAGILVSAVADSALGRDLLTVYPLPSGAPVAVQVSPRGAPRDGGQYPLASEEVIVTLRPVARGRDDTGDDPRR